MDCIFCKIISGEMSSFVLYEDDTFKVVLDRFPTTEGHTLIIPKAHAKDMFDLPEETAKKLYPLAQKIGKKLMKATGATGLNIVQNNGEVAGQSVHHFHMHLVPRKENDGVTLNQGSNMNTTEEDLKKVLEKIQEQ